MNSNPEAIQRGRLNAAFQTAFEGLDKIRVELNTEFVACPEDTEAQDELTYLHSALAYIHEFLLGIAEHRVFVKRFGDQISIDWERLSSVPSVIASDPEIFEKCD